MNKVRFLLLSIVFIIFTALGFTIAKEFRGIISAFVTKATPTSSSSKSNQQNILIVHVNELEKQDPELVSIWALFLAYYDTPYINLKMLYPSPSLSASDMVTSSLFQIDSNGRLSEQFIRSLDKYKIQWDGYFLIDQEALRTIYTWVNKEDPGLADILPRGNENIKIVIYQETNLINGLCGYLENSQDQQVKTHWSEIIPHHMRTDMNFESVIINWERLTSTPNTPHCEIIESR